MKLGNSVINGALLASVALGYNPVVEPIEKLTTTEAPRPWIRTIYGTKVEIVTPTIVAGILISGKPAEPTNSLEPWVSLEKDGSPKTIKPELKNGQIHKGKPDYSTYFQTASIRTYSYEELQAHNMDINEVFEEEIMVPEDDTYLKLNPIIRCTPERYFKRANSRTRLSAPFCTPHENIEWKSENSYFVSWYTRFFDDDASTIDEQVQKVRIHLSYVKESSKDKGIFKRDIPATFFSSEWLDNDSGIYPIEVREEWFQDYFERKVVLSIQPDSIPDDEFNPLDNGILLRLRIGAKVFKKTDKQLRLEESGLHGEKWWYIALSIPTVAVIIAFIFYIYYDVATRKQRDFSNITAGEISKKHRVIGKVSNIPRLSKLKNKKYSELPISGKSDKQY